MAESAKNPVLVLADCLAEVAGKADDWQREVLLFDYPPKSSKTSREERYDRVEATKVATLDALDPVLQALGDAISFVGGIKGKHPEQWPDEVSEIIHDFRSEILARGCFLPRDDGRLAVWTRMRGLWSLWDQMQKLGATMPTNRTWAKAGKLTQRRRPPLEQRTRPLTTRQTEVMQIVGECKGSFAEAARRLRLNHKTVREHYAAALRKLGKAGVRAPERKLKPKVTRLPEGGRGEAYLAAQAEDTDS